MEMYYSTVASIAVLLALVFAGLMMFLSWRESQDPVKANLRRIRRAEVKIRLLPRTTVYVRGAYRTDKVHEELNLRHPWSQRSKSA